MKKLLVAGLVLALSLVLCVSAVYAGAADGLVQFTDPELEDAVRGVTGIKNGPIATADAEKIVLLNFEKIEEDSINDLGGIEAFTALEAIRLNAQDIWDLTPLKALPNLVSIEFGDSAVSDLEPLRDMHLKELFLYGNQIEDLSPLEGMESLEVLVLAGNRITDVSPLAGLKNLRVLILADNPIGDFTVLEDIYGQLEDTDFELVKSETVHFNDPVLEARVREQLDFPEGELTVAGVKDYGYLDLSGEEGGTEKITDLSGIEAFENLEGLAAFYNDIEDITPLAALGHLRELDLGSNHISDLTPLKDLPLEFLVFWGNQVSDISPLSGMDTLRSLYMDSNQIFDLYPLAGLTELETLSAEGNEIVDIAPLMSLQNLRYLQLGNNHINDVSPLAGLNLIELYLWNNEIGDLSPLQNMIYLERLDLINNHIADISALAGMTRLRFLGLDGNQITDYSPVAAFYDSIEEKDFELDARTMMLMNGENPDEVIIFDDPVLVQWVRKALGVSGDITVGMAANVTELNLEMDGGDWSYPRISSLNGIQYFTNVEGINLGWALYSDEGQVDLSPLSSLSKLHTLQLHCDNLHDISALAGLTGLRNLWIWGNNISDISALAGMTQMESLWMFGNHISDISALQNMSNLYNLMMASNNVADLSPLSGLMNLCELEIADNPVFDYHALDAVYPHLTQKDFDINQETGFLAPENPDAVVVFGDALLEDKVRQQMNKLEGDITALDAARVTSLNFSVDWREDLSEDEFIFSLEGLEYFINLKSLALYQNAVSDLTPLAGLTKLENLDFVNNQVSDLTPIGNLTQLKTLSFSNNNVEDISALKNLINLNTLWMRQNPIADYTPIETLYATYESTDFAYGETFERYYKPENPDDVVVFPDKMLEKRIRGYIGKLEGDIYVTDIAFIEDLWLGSEWQESYADGDRITDLTGLENCLNVKNIDLSNNDIRDLSPLRGMKKLQTLNLINCGIEDISPLQSLTTLWWLDISYNRITDISALSGMTKLEGLHLSHNPIGDHTPIQAIYENLTDKDFEYGDVTLAPEDPDAVVVFADPLFERLVRAYTGMPDGPITAKQAAGEERLDFNMQWQENIPDDTRIHDLTGIEYFINLKQLSLNFHAVTDISMLPGLKRLKELELGGNGFKNLSILANMPNLTRLVLFGNEIEDVSPLAGLTKLTYLQLEHNLITDITPLSGMTELTTLWLTDNPITDYFPIHEIVPNLTDKDF